MDHVNAAGRKRRRSPVNAKRMWYARYRQFRFARFMGQPLTKDLRALILGFTSERGLQLSKDSPL